MQWKDGKVVKAVIRSALGGNLRLRVPNEMQMNGAALKEARGNNSNPFYKVEEIPAPIISDKAIITPPHLEKTFVYDVATEKGKMYMLVIR